MWRAVAGGYLPPTRPPTTTTDWRERENDSQSVYEKAIQVGEKIKELAEALAEEVKGLKGQESKGRRKDQEG